MKMSAAAESALSNFSKNQSNTISVYQSYDGARNIQENVFEQVVGDAS